MHWSVLYFLARDTIYNVLAMIVTRTSFLSVVIFVGVILTLPFFVHGATGAASAMQSAIDAGMSASQAAGLNWSDAKTADVACVPKVDKQCPCGPGFNPKTGKCDMGKSAFLCPCQDPRGVTGICMEVMECRATGFTNEKGGAGGAPGLDQVAKMLGDLMGKLMGGGGGGGSPSTPTTPTGGTGCLGSYYQTSDVSKISDPCAQYTPAVSDYLDTGGSCSPLNESLGLCTSGNCPDVTIVTCAAGSHAVSGGSDANNCARSDKCVSDTTGTTTVPTKTSTTTGRIIYASTTGAFFLPPGGFRGDISARDSGATVIGGARDTQGNVEVAGFYGSQTFNGGAQGLVGSWCKTRPWATNFLSKIVTPSFFDNLCKTRGYQVGTPTTTPAVVLQQTKKPKSTVATTTVATSTYSGVPPKVDIWAVPASVPLGGRTSIFWNTQGVKDCTVTSPSGGFNQNSLSGGAATQPITAATTFSISCLSLADNSPVTASVTVNLKI